MDSKNILERLWQSLGLPPEALQNALLTGADPVLPSSFAVGAAAQTTIAAAALAACELGYLRGLPRQKVCVNMQHAALECVGWFSLNEEVPELWDKLSGLYRCRDGWARIHANFEHHRNGALRLLGLDPATAERGDVEREMRMRSAFEFETAVAEAGLVATALRSFDEWDATLQGMAIAAQPLFTIEPIGSARDVPPLSLASCKGQHPLHGVRVLDLTRILAGPVAGRTLAAYGADVMLINSPHLPNIGSIAETSRGKLSAHADLRTATGRETLNQLLAGVNVFIQGYRPQGLAVLGFGPRDVAACRPGIVYASLSAYGASGPWATRRGFDSLVQTAMGFNDAEGKAYRGECDECGDQDAGSKPKPLPMQILDHATGYLLACGISVALVRQQQEGGSWHVKVSLAQTAHWLRSLGRIQNGFNVVAPDAETFLETSPSGFGKLTAIRHSAQLAHTPAVWTRPSMPPGSHAAVWPDMLA